MRQDARNVARYYQEAWDVAGRCNASQDAQDATPTDQTQGPFLLMQGKQGGMGRKIIALPMLKDVRRRAAWECGLYVPREAEAGPWRARFWGGSRASERTRAVSNASRCCLWRLDGLEVALSLPDRINPGGRTPNSTLRYKCLEVPAHWVSRERCSAR